MTGVFVLEIGSLLLQPVNSNRLQRRFFTQRRNGATNWFSVVALRRCVKTLSDFLVVIIFTGGTVILFLGQRLTRDAIFSFDPLAKVDELAALRTEGTKWIVFPFDWLTAGWTLH